MWYNVKDQPQSRKAVITSRDDLMEDGVETKGNGRAVEGEALLHMEELGNYTLKYLARRRTRKPPHDLVTGRTPDYMLSN